jgi:hypothetical protein
MRDAERWQEAGDAYEAAAGMVSDKGQKAGFTLKAAEMKYKAARKGSRRDRIKILEQTRKLYTDFLIPEKPAEQTRLLKRMADPGKWLSKEDWKKIKRRPDALLTAAEIFFDSSPKGLDGRWIGIRLVKHLHSFTVPVEDQAKPKLTEFIPIWWNGAEFILTAYLQIAKSGSGQVAQKAASEGHTFARKIIFQFHKMDGPERVERINALEKQLKLLTRK